MYLIFILWSVEVIAFFAIFSRWQASGSQSLSHGAVLMFYFLYFVSLAYLVSTSFKQPLARRAASSVILGVAFFWLCLFHLMVASSLASWGQLPTVELVLAYANEISYLEETLGVERFTLLGTAIFALFAACSLHWFFLGSRSNCRIAPKLQLQLKLAWRERLLLIVLVTLTLPTFVAVYAQSGWPTQFREPVYVALNGESWRLSQSTPVTGLRLQQLQVVENRSRLAYRPAPATRPRNVVLFTVDALRADRLSISGYSRETTPKLAELVSKERAAIFSEARSACAESYCGLLSLLTGKDGHKLAERNFGLVEVLNLSGYHTTAVLSGDHSTFYGLREKYGPFHVSLDGSVNSQSQTSINDDGTVLGHLRSIPPYSGQPSFFFVHLMSAHGLGRKLPQYQRWTPAKSVFNLRVSGSAPDVRAAVQNGYDNGVLQADSIMANAIEILRAKGYLNDAVMFVTGDHGEFLGEAGLYSHSKTLLDPVLRVPWIWVGTEFSAVQRSRPVVHADFAPTLLAELGINAPNHWDGKNVRGDVARLYSFHEQGEHAAVIEYTGAARIKYVIDRRSGKEQAFDLINDPEELSNVLATLGEVNRSRWRGLLLKESLIRPHSCGTILVC